MTRTAQAKSLLFAPATAEDFWPEVNAAARLRTPSQPPPLPSEPEDADPTGGLDLGGLEEPQTSSTTTFAAGTTVPAEGDVRISIAELRELLLARIGDTRDSDGQRAPSTSSPEPQATDPVTVKAPRRRPVPLNLGLMLLVLVALVIAGGVTLVVVAQRAVPPVSPAAPATGQLSIVSDVPHAQVSIDGQDRGVTPLEVALDPGAHAVEVTSGGRRETMAVSIARGARDVFHVLLTSANRVAVGALRVSTPIPGAGITLDGEYRGLTPMTFAQLEPGFHEVAVVQGRITERHAVNVEQDRTTEISVAFATPAPAPAPAPPPVTSPASSGWIVVACPIPVEILENGDLVGSSNVARVMMASGSHVLDFVNTDVGYRARRTIDVVAGKTTRVPMELPQGALSVNAMPWAELWVDGSHVGETPLGNVPVRIGRHDIVFKHPQLGERRLQVLVRADTPARVSVDMSK